MSSIIPLVENSKIEITDSEGCYVIDKKGNRYLDLESGVWCVNLGHKNKAVCRVISRQLNSTFHLGYQVSSPLPEKLSTVLNQKFRFTGGKSVFLSSGSEAVDLSISIAKHLSGRKKICKLESSYLGAYGQGKSSGRNPNLVSIKNNDFEKLASIDFSEIAAFVFEPGTAWGLVLFPSELFISEIVGRAREKGSYIIVDEVTTGMGRTGKWFGYEHYSMRPDIIACGKGLGNGYPVSSVTLSHNTTSDFEKNPFRYAQSHQNDPIACAVALEVFKQMEKRRMIPRTEEEGILFKSLLKEIANKYQSVKAIRGRGLMIAIEFDKDEDAQRTHRLLMENRIITGLKLNVLRLMPPLILEPIQIHETVDKLDEILQ